MGLQQGKGMKMESSENEREDQDRIGLWWEKRTKKFGAEKLRDVRWERNGEPKERERKKKSVRDNFSVKISVFIYDKF